MLCVCADCVVVWTGPGSGIDLLGRVLALLGREVQVGMDRVTFGVGVEQEIMRYHDCGGFFLRCWVDFSQVTSVSFRCLTGGEGYGRGIARRSLLCLFMCGFSKFLQTGLFLEAVEYFGNIGLSALDVAGDYVALAVQAVNSIW